jgi:hypothetical protein
VGAFDAGWAELGRFPFRHALHEFNPSSGTSTHDALGAWLAMVVVFISSLAISFWVVRAMIVQ